MRSMSHNSLPDNLLGGLTGSCHGLIRDSVVRECTYVQYSSLGGELLMPQSRRSVGRRLSLFPLAFNMTLAAFATGLLVVLLLTTLLRG